MHYWRTIARDSKSQELKKDIEILAQTFERILDRYYNFVYFIFLEKKVLLKR